MRLKIPKPCSTSDPLRKARRDLWLAHRALRRRQGEEVVSSRFRWRDSNPLLDIRKYRGLLTTGGTSPRPADRRPLVARLPADAWATELRYQAGCTLDHTPGEDSDYSIVMAATETTPMVVDYVKWATAVRSGSRGRRKRCLRALREKQAWDWKDGQYARPVRKVKDEAHDTARDGVD